MKAWALSFEFFVLLLLKRPFSLVWSLVSTLHLMSALWKTNQPCHFSSAFHFWRKEPICWCISGSSLRDLGRHSPASAKWSPLLLSYSGIHFLLACPEGASLASLPTTRCVLLLCSLGSESPFVIMLLNLYFLVGCLPLLYPRLL